MGSQHDGVLPANAATGTGDNSDPTFTQLAHHNLLV
jgi:hypothetical protein